MKHPAGPQAADYLEGLMEGFVAYDAGWVMTYMNAAGERLLGRRREDVLGKTWHEAFPHAVGNPVDEMYQRVMAKRVAERMEYFYPHYGVWMEISASPVSGGGVGVYFQDITARKAAEQALREAARRKDEFLAVLAHELRNPLAPISTAVEVLNLQGPALPALQSARAIIGRQVVHMARLIDDLMDASRITSGKLELRREPVALSAVVEQALETARPHLQGHEFTLSLPAEPLWVDADPVRLAQVFSNLLNNACKFTPQGGRIRLAVERSGGWVNVTVADSGVGIPPGKLESVFEMFSQAAPPLDRAQGGLGIGLSLARELARMHGGDLAARSEGAGRGSAFTVTLPLREPPAPPRRRERARDANAPLRILVVDDNADAAASLAMLLRAEGHEVEVAHDGPSAVAAAAAARHDAVLLDLGLPGMDGLATCRAMRAAPGGGGVFIAALTGWGQDEDQRKSREAGFDAHLVKPVGLDVLRTVLAPVRRGP